MTDGSPDPTAAVLAAAAVLGIPLDPDDVPAVAERFGLLMGFAASLGEVDAEPAPVFLP